MPSVVIVGAQWGDEGKGKITDFLARDADMVVRYQGGANAGHTVVVDGVTYKLHLVPSGIIHGKTCVIGNGCVVDPETLLREIEYLHGHGVDTQGRLWISDAAHLIMPYHQRLDALQEQLRGDQRIGTTGRGIGPAYADKAARTGIRVGDLLDEALFRQRLERNVRQLNDLMHRVYDSEPFDVRAIAEQYLDLASRLRPYITDTAALINEALDQGRRVLFEGAQGTMLDLDHGSYPYVTSSYPSAGGACIGAGVGPTRIDHVIGVAKAYTSRVGDGPFPTELDDEIGEWIRQKGREFGTTTGRPRRCGWLDAVVLRHAVQVSGLGGLALVHLDTLGGLERVRIASAYEYRGQRLERLPHGAHQLAQCRPIYEELPGWDEDISSARRFEDLPENARNYVRRVEALVGVPVQLLSIGPDRAQTIALDDVFAAAARARGAGAR
nr:adenylosuccinate synthase [Bacillota bacterium]